MGQKIRMIESFPNLFATFVCIVAYVVQEVLVSRRKTLSSYSKVHTCRYGKTLCNLSVANSDRHDIQQAGWDCGSDVTVLVVAGAWTYACLCLCRFIIAEGSVDDERTVFIIGI